jgi:hypothetical protein
MRNNMINVEGFDSDSGNEQEIIDNPNSTEWEKLNACMKLAAKLDKGKVRVQDPNFLQIPQYVPCDEESAYGDYEPEKDEYGLHVAKQNPVLPEIEDVKETPVMSPISF